MINLIKSNQALKNHLYEKIEDEGISVNIDSSISKDKYAAIKVDEYYNNLKMPDTPKSVDFVVVVDAISSWYKMYILELKNHNNPKHINIPDIQEKFYNTIELFLKKDFSTIFLNDKFKYKQVELYLISDVYNEVGKYQNHSQYLKLREKMNKIDSLKVDLNLSNKIFKFRGQILRINYDIPPNPLITNT